MPLVPFVVMGVAMQHYGKCFAPHETFSCWAQTHSKVCVVIGNEHQRPVAFPLVVIAVAGSRVWRIRTPRTPSSQFPTVSQNVEYDTINRCNLWASEKT